MASIIDIAKSMTNARNVEQIQEFVVEFLKSKTISKYIIGKIVKFYLTQSKITINQYFESNIQNIIVEILTKIHPVIGSDGQLSQSSGESASMKISDLYQQDEFVETFYWKSLGVFSQVPKEPIPIVMFVPTEHLIDLINEGFDLFVNIQMEFIRKRE